MQTHLGLEKNPKSSNRSLKEYITVMWLPLGLKKYYFICFPDSNKILNKISKLVSRCHDKKYLKNQITSRPFFIPSTSLQKSVKYPKLNMLYEGITNSPNDRRREIRSLIFLYIYIYIYIYIYKQLRKYTLCLYIYI